MTARRPTTITEYVRAAPPRGQPHLRRLHAILKKAAPRADAIIKWGNPFFVEPRFLFAYSANKAHLNFAPGGDAMKRFREDLKAHKTTRYFLQVPYDLPLPERLIRKIAKYRVQAVRARADDGFW